MIDLVGVKSGQIRALWKFAEPWLREAIDRTKGMMTDESVQESCQNKENQLWLLFNDGDPIGAALTQVRILRTGEKTVHILASGAKDRYYIFDCEDTLAKWAQSMGATRFTMDGRLGWAKVLKDWNIVSVMMEKEIVRR